MAPRSAYRPFAVTLVERRQLSRNFVRLTFAGPDLSEFADTCLDQRIKLVLGTDAQLDEAAAAPSWLDWWRDQPNDERPTMRTYTARFVRREEAQVDVDFVTHGTTGPASRFAIEAPVGARAILVGAYADHPEADTQGLAWRRAGASTVLLAGDETAQPAIANILRSLPAHVTGAAFLEVTHPDDAMPLETAAEVAVTYLPRSTGENGTGEDGTGEDGAGEDGADSADADAAGEGHARGTRLTEAVRDWTQAWTAEAEGSAEAAGASGADDIDADVTTTETGILWEEGAEGGGLRVLVAADAGTVRGLRQVLLKEQGLDRKSCSFMGYWRLGAREGE